jgi:subtilase family serine protease
VLAGQRRGVPDISMSAACNGAVIIHLGVPGIPPGFYEVCGTSEASPLFAGIVALAAQVAGHPLGLINPALYAMSAAHASGIVDVTSGNNSVALTQGGSLRRRHGVGTRLRPGTGAAGRVAPGGVPRAAGARA